MKKKCKECHKVIDKDIAKCNECGAFQDWRQYMPYMQLTAIGLSILLATISVFSSFYPIFIDLNTPNFRVKVNKISANAKYYSLVITNSGKQPLSIEYIHLFFGDRYINLEIKGDDNILPVNKTRILQLLLPKKFTSPIDLDFSHTTLKGDIEERCTVNITVAGDGKLETISLTEDSCQNSGLYDFITRQQGVG